MEEMEYTPGPWVCPSPANGSSIRHPVILSDGGVVAMAQWCDNTQKTNANARLIAAAPELLEALQHIMRCIPYGGSATIRYDSSTCAQINAAIAKAESQKQNGGA